MDSLSLRPWLRIDARASSALFNTPLSSAGSANIASNGSRGSVPRIARVKGSLEGNDHPPAEERRRCVLALGRMVGRKDQSRERHEFEGLLELPLGHQGIAPGDSFEDRRAGEVLAGQVGADVREPAAQARR